jgi:hypothetical protein
VKRGDDLDIPIPKTATRQTVLAVLRSAAQQTGRSKLAGALKQGRTVYQSEPRKEGGIERIDPTGRRTKGRFENGRFVPANPSRNRSK